MKKLRTKLVSAYEVDKRELEEVMLEFLKNEGIAEPEDGLLISFYDVEDRNALLAVKCKAMSKEDREIMRDTKYFLTCSTAETINILSWMCSKKLVARGYYRIVN